MFHCSNLLLLKQVYIQKAYSPKTWVRRKQMEHQQRERDEPRLSEWNRKQIVVDGLIMCEIFKIDWTILHFVSPRHFYQSSTYMLDSPTPPPPLKILRHTWPGCPLCASFMAREPGLCARLCKIM